MKENTIKQKEHIQKCNLQKMKESDKQDQEDYNKFGSQNPFLGLPLSYKAY